MDKVTLVKDKNNKIIQRIWESNKLKQITYYSYNNKDLIEEKIIQIDIETNATKIMHCKYGYHEKEIILIDEEKIDVIVDASVPLRIDRNLGEIKKNNRGNRKNKPRNIYKVTLPDNSEIEVTNLRLFCQDNELNYNSFLKFDGSLKDYKGYKLEKLGKINEDNCI